MLKKGVLFEKLQDKKIKCNICSHRCVISDGKYGICGTRKNIDGVIYSTIYNTVSSEAIDPIEKKPLYHFLPSSLSYSLGSIGCNFRCEHCQNWSISQLKLSHQAYTFEITPEQAVSRAIQNGCKSIVWTYNEPAIWHEYTYDSMIIAKKFGLKTAYVTNGYITSEALERIAPYLDAFRVDIKSFSEDFYKKVCGAKLSNVLKSTKLAHELGIHVETITLLIPGLNDSIDEITKLVEWIYENLGENTPVHFTRFYPMYKMTDSYPTPIETMEKAYNIAKQKGMNYVYLGNVSGHKYENTYCPKCNNLLIKRDGFEVSINKIKNGKCFFCGEKIPIIL